MSLDYDKVDPDFVEWRRKRAKQLENLGRIGALSWVVVEDAFIAGRKLGREQ